MYWTKDAHDNESAYLNTQEGKILPVPHCRKHTWGCSIHEDCLVSPNDCIVEKQTFGSNFLASALVQKDIRLKWAGVYTGIQAIVLGGYCSDICGISNALLLKAALPEVPIYWLAYAGAGVTPDKNAAALEVMHSCQIHIINTYDEFQELCYDLDKEAGAK